MRRATIASGFLALFIAGAGLFAAPSAQAQYAYGEMVAYDLVFPVAGPTTYFDSFYGARYNGIHHAQDLMADKMVPVVAAASGTVYYVNGTSNPNWNGGSCCTLRVRHDDGWTSVYIHLNNDTPGTDDGQGWGIAPGIEIGTRVQAGQLIGYVGDSGNAESTPPHLHFELHDPDGVHVNPYQALRTAQGKPAPKVEPAPNPAQCEVPDTVALNALLDGSGLLRAGSRGSGVEQLQEFLTQAGYDPGPIDGVFGAKTTAGLAGFQTANGLRPDGVVGPVTRAAIRDVATALPSAPALDVGNRVIRPGYRGTDVQAVQELLKLAGHDPGPADGVYGPLTQASVAAFQRAYGGITVDGKVGPNTRQALADALGLGDVDAGCG